MGLSTQRLITIGCFTVGVGMCVFSLTVRNDIRPWLTYPGLLLWIVAGVLVRRARGVQLPPRETIEPQRKFLLMLLRRTSANLTAPSLEAAARSAWEERFGVNEDGSDFVESGQEGPGFVIQGFGNAFLAFETQKGVRNLTPPTIAETESDLLLWPDHSFELSIGVAYAFDADPLLGEMTGSLCAALMDDDTLAVLHPASGQLWRSSREIGDRLESEPYGFFGAS